MKRFTPGLAALLLAGCGSSGEDVIDPVPADGNASAGHLMREAEQAAGNAQGMMSAEAGSDNLANSQGETR